MIISHEHKFIFIKLRKVAGSSMERSLADVCGPNDVITEDPCEPPLARNWDAGRIPIVRELTGTADPIRWARSIRDWRSRPMFYTHLDAYAVRQRLGKKTWDSYYKFCFDRNPWDKCVSFYWWFYRRAEKPALSFREHMLKRWLLTDRHLPSDWKRYTLGNTPIVDFVGDFAKKEDDFAKAMREIGVECSIGHREKTSTRRDGGRDLAAIYDDETRARVARVFRHEIREFGWTFPE